MNRWLFAGLALALAVCPACDEKTADGPRTIKQVRTVAKAGPTQSEASSAERFGFEQTNAPLTANQDMTGPMAGGPTPADGHQAAGLQLAWSAPAGWEEIAPTPTRHPNFIINKLPDAQCYVTVLGGAAGGAEANINRWRAQLGLPPLTAGELAALPKIPLLGQDAPYVELRGDYKEMSGAVKPGTLLAGALTERDGQAVFVKLTGPAAVMQGELEKFKMFCASLKVTEKVSDAKDSPANAGPTSPSQTSALSPAPALAWDVPAGWREGPGRPMRVVTFTLGEGAATECYVAMLGGAAGGVEANINRWRGQMSQPPLTADEIGKLEKIDVLGRPAPMVLIEGAYTGMAGSPMGGGPVEKAKKNTAMLATVAQSGGQSVFVKMIGPVAQVKSERESFVKFCRSLRAK